MKASGEFKKLRTIRSDMNRSKERLDRINSAMLRTTRPTSAGPGGSSVEDLIGEQVAEAEEMADELASKIIGYEAKLQAADKLLDKLPEKYRELMKLRYYDRLGWLEVAEECHFSITRCYQLHAEALELIDKAADEENTTTQVQT